MVVVGTAVAGIGRRASAAAAAASSARRTRALHVSTCTAA
jgi:hypothetical protein